jgi:hypothetical protein
MQHMPDWWADAMSKAGEARKQKQQSKATGLVGAHYEPGGRPEKGGTAEQSRETRAAA